MHAGVVNNPYIIGNGVSIGGNALSGFRVPDHASDDFEYNYLENTALDHRYNGRAIERNTVARTETQHTVAVKHSVIGVLLCISEEANAFLPQWIRTGLANEPVATDADREHSKFIAKRISR